MVYKDQAPSCIQWCQSAKECLGTQMYDMIMGQMKEKQKLEEKDKAGETQ